MLAWTFLPVSYYRNQPKGRYPTTHINRESRVPQQPHYQYAFLLMVEAQDAWAGEEVECAYRLDSILLRMVQRFADNQAGYSNSERER